jgi:hypothetical protein
MGWRSVVMILGASWLVASLSCVALSQEPHHPEIKTMLDKWEGRPKKIASAEIAWTAEVASATNSDGPGAGPPIFRSTFKRRLRFCDDQFLYESSGKKFDGFRRFAFTETSSLFLSPEGQKRFFANAQEGKLIDGVFVPTATSSLGHVFPAKDGLDALTIYDLRALIMWSRPMMLRFQDFAQSKWTIESERDQIAGLSCVKAMRKKHGTEREERYWVAKELDYLPVKIEFREQETNVFTLELKIDSESKQIKGWSESTYSPTGDFISSGENEINELKLNSISKKSDVSFEFPPGTRVSDHGGGKGYIAPEAKKP